MRYASVIVDVLNQDVDRIFTYQIPESLNVCEGYRVLVPFGRQGNIEGIVIGLTDKTDVPSDKMKSIHSCIDGIQVVNEEQIRLAAWIKKEYHTTMADALRLFIPSEVRGGKVKTKYIQMVKCLKLKALPNIFL